MPRIPLTIDPAYASSWGFWEGTRELIQNAADADEFENMKMSIRHSTQTNKLTITSEDCAISPALLLLLGATSKRDAGQRGRFGEGFSVGVLALVRAGHPITIYNGAEVWRPLIETPDEGHPFEGSQLLVFNTRALPKPRTDFTVEVENVSKEVWDATKKLFLFLQKPKASEVVETSNGTVLLNEDYRGMVFSRGIFVTRNEELECGYDLPNLMLDRDRHTIDDWNLRYRLGELWNTAQAAAPEKFAQQIYKMAKENKAEVRSLHYNADKKLLKLLRDSFEAEHGEATVPVADMTQSKDLEQLGAKTAVVNKTLLELLEKGGPSVEERKKQLQGSVKEIHAWGDLESAERSTCTTWVDRVTKEYVVVTFNDATTPCRYLEDLGKVGINRATLELPSRDLVCVVAQQEARRRGAGTTNEMVLLDVIFGVG